MTTALIILALIAIISLWGAVKYAENRSLAQFFTFVLYGCGFLIMFLIGLYIIANGDI